MSLNIKLLILSLVLVLDAALAFKNFPGFHPEAAHPDQRAGNGQPLILTPYLNDPATAQKYAKVDSIGNFTSYSGFFTVNATTGSNTYFWFFPAQNGDVNAPVVVWLQGGPGASSLFGLFGEIGPFSVAANAKDLIGRASTWNKEFSLLFIDNPVGVGFSFTQSTDGYVRDEYHVGRDLYSFITQFFTVFNQYAKNDFYIAGESYAGKYVPAFAWTVHENNKKNPAVFVNLKGISIGDGGMDPKTMFTGYSDLLYYVGFADDRQVKVLKDYEHRIAKAIERKEWAAGFKVFDEMLNGDFYPYPTYFQNITGVTNYFNLYNPVYPANPYTAFLNSAPVRDAIHVGLVPYYGYNGTVEQYLIEDWLKSVEHFLAPLFDNYKVLVYNGNFDLILGPPLCEKFLKTLHWKGAATYEQSPRQIWKVNNNVAGYVRQALSFTQVVVLSAGHMVPADQPLHAHDMITKFIKGQPFS
jgi:vitellogenic carboxypeptidase-like protein